MSSAHSRFRFWIHRCVSRNSFLRGPIKSVPAILAAVSVITFSAPSFGAGFRTWTGSESKFWSNPNNWSPVGAPQNGDILDFEGFDQDVSNTSMMNDLVDL